MELILKILNKISPKFLLLTLKIFRRKKQSEIVLFLIEFPESYHNFKGLIKEFSNSSKYEVEVLFYQGKYSIKNKSNFDSLKKLDNVKYSSEIYDWNYDKIFIHNPFDLEREKKYNFFNLLFSCNQLIYISYGVEIAGLRSHSQFNMPAQRYADRIFVHSTSAKNQYEKYCQTGSNHVSDIGHPFFENIKEYKKNNTYDYMLCFHHSVDKEPFDLCTFNKFIEFFLSFFNSNSNKLCLFRPHPMLRAKLEELDNTKLYDELISLSNVTLDTSNNFFTSFELSKTLITDIGSFLMIFPFYKKPLLILANSSSHLGDDGKYFLSNLCFDKSMLKGFLENSKVQDKMLINPKILGIETKQISSSIFKTLCAE